MGEAIKAFGQSYGQGNPMEQLVLSAILQQMGQQQRNVEAQKRSQQITPYQQAMIDLSNRKLTADTEHKQALSKIQSMMAEAQAGAIKQKTPAQVEALKARTGLTSAQTGALRQKTPAEIERMKAKTALENRIQSVQEIKTQHNMMLQRRNMQRLEQNDKIGQEYRSKLLQETIDARKSKDKLLRQKLTDQSLRDRERIGIQRDLAENKKEMDKFKAVLAGKQYESFDKIQTERVKILGQGAQLHKKQYELEKKKWETGFDLKKKEVKSVIEQRKSMIDNARKQLSLAKTNSEQAHNLRNFIAHHNALLKDDEMDLKQGQFREAKQNARIMTRLKQVDQTNRYELSKKDYELKAKSLLQEQWYHKQLIQQAKERLKVEEKGSENSRKLRKYIADQEHYIQELDVSIRHKKYRWGRNKDAQLLQMQKESQKFGIDFKKIRERTRSKEFQQNLDWKYKSLQAKREAEKTAIHQRELSKQQAIAEKHNRAVSISGERRFAGLEKSIQANIQQIQKFFSGPGKNIDNFKVALTSLVENLRDKKKLANQINQANPQLGYNPNPGQTTLDMLNRSSNYFSGQTAKKYQDALSKIANIPATVAINSPFSDLAIGDKIRKKSELLLSRPPLPQPEPINMMISNYLNQIQQQQQPVNPVQQTQPGSIPPYFRGQ